ncbi:hypothetical protein [Photobacterium halotolerans]|uniref:Uncharacterized protein n=1 Tax=Photobacterium halotolerans TaxID=265726 RepID=A0A0F5V6Y8_9GAMM|nr:hypothetical protein [Photobacterium halotolerans]KKC97893.1 hypothetical protein KY46_21370 [Photobacterium halotolerans]
MNQTKSNKPDSKKDNGDVTKANNHFSSVLLTGEAAKLGAKSKGNVVYEIAQHDEDKQLYFRIAGQTEGAGLHSRQWILLNSLFELIESQADKPWKSQLYKTLFSGGSANNHGFCGAIVRGLGLAKKSDSSIYLHVAADDYLERKAEILGLSEPKKK